MKSNIVTVRLTFDVTYALNGESSMEMIQRLHNMCAHAINEGMLTGATEAYVEEYSAHASLTSSLPLAFGHRLCGKDGDSYCAQAWH